MESTNRGHDVARELAVDVKYKGVHVAWHRLDRVIVERYIDFPKRIRPEE